MLLEGNDSSGNGLSIVAAIRRGVGEELAGETGLFRELVTKLLALLVGSGLELLALLVGSGLELLDGLSEHCVHLGLFGPCWSG